MSSRISTVSSHLMLLHVKKVSEELALIIKLWKSPRLTCQVLGHGEQSHNCVGTPTLEQSQQNTSSPYQQAEHRCSWEVSHSHHLEISSKYSTVKWQVSATKKNGYSTTVLDNYRELPKIHLLQPCYMELKIPSWNSNKYRNLSVMDSAIPSPKRAGGSLSSEDWKVHTDFWPQQLFYMWLYNSSSPLWSCWISHWDSQMEYLLMPSYTRGRMTHFSSPSSPYTLP